MLLELKAIRVLDCPIGLVQVHVDVVHGGEAGISLGLHGWPALRQAWRLIQLDVEFAFFPAERLKAHRPPGKHHVIALQGSLLRVQPTVIQLPQVAVTAQVDRRVGHIHVNVLLGRGVAELLQPFHHVVCHLWHLDQDGSGRDVPRKGGEAQATFGAGVELWILITVQGDARQCAGDGSWVARVNLFKEDWERRGGGGG